ncbi:beta-lactamase family protein [Spirosoma sp. BT702]|uniref:Beta-lactamase family protein n=1 Tax=Spirosoma profusum TaxID=2771354 RepID=A0A927AM73_9BACT|nr:serine hydrolase domain-containing protein [Spirosoma profusum]MBD2699209.1 beta-lactamase family protein [Spirosoma profusum]
MNAWFTLALLLVTTLVEPAQPNALAELTTQPPKISSDNSLKNRVDSLVDQAIQQFMGTPQAVGLSLGIVQNGQTQVYNYGTVEKGRTQLPTSQTLYAIASITKTFTGALLAQAVVEKRLNLDDDVRKYLDGNYPNLAYEGHPIRLYHLLNHRSGLPFLLPSHPDVATNANTSASAISMQQERINPRSDFYAELHQVKLDTIPGHRFRYSNTGAQLLGYILEKVYSMPFEELVRQKIAQPLDMSSTKISLTPAEQARQAKGYDVCGNVTASDADELQAAGALKSTVDDMLKFVYWNVAEQSKPVRLTHQPTWSDGATYSAGLNWQMIQSGTNRVIWQDGNIPGFSSLCVNYPELNLGIIVLTNECDRTTAQRVTSMTNQIAKALDERAVLLPR